MNASTLLCRNPLRAGGPSRFTSIEILEARIAPATLIWDGSAGDGDWFNAQNWDQNAVPDNDDTAILNTNSTINLTSNATVSSFQQSNGVLTSPADVTLTVLTSLDWSGGTMSGAGPTSVTKVAATAMLSVSGPSIKTLQQRAISNDGITIWSDGTIIFGGNAVFENGGSFIAQGNATIDTGGNGNSFINKAGASFDKNTGTGTTEMQAPFANAGTVTVASGELKFRDSFAQTAGVSRLSGGSISTDSALTTGNVNNNGATVRPGTSGAGQLTVNGNYTQGSGATLAIEIGGTTAGTQYDQLNITGTATLGGILAPAYINGFTSTTGDVFSVLVAGTRSGTFATVNALDLLMTNYTATQAQLVNNIVSYVWDGSAGDSNWFTPANWTPEGLPGAGDQAVLDNGQTINLPSSTLVGYFKQTNGTFTSPAGVTFTVLHNYLWTGGTMSGAGVTNANGGLLMNVRGFSIFFLMDTP